MSTLYISPLGSGTKDGSSWENAGTINRIATFITAAGPGSEVLLRADQGAYRVSSPILLRDGGTSGAPVTIRGVDGTGTYMKAEFIGTRSAPYYSGAAQ